MRGQKAGGGQGALEAPLWHGLARHFCLCRAACRLLLQRRTRRAGEEEEAQWQVKEMLSKERRKRPGELGTVAEGGFSQRESKARLTGCV